MRRRPRAQSCSWKRTRRCVRLAAQSRRCAAVTLSLACARASRAGVHGRLQDAHGRYHRRRNRRQPGASQLALHLPLRRLLALVPCGSVVLPVRASLTCAGTLPVLCGADAQRGGLDARDDRVQRAARQAEPRHGGAGRCVPRRSTGPVRRTPPQETCQPGELLTRLPSPRRAGQACARCRRVSSTRSRRSWR